ncbi:cell division protein FtsZ [Hwanghaeella grinnelliae]|uniref:Cell division protein FtsZ n=1 Tax=Hwanghaeella grinnelliae TaxID=2500179 RepID=A0A437QJD6_9PROT|nr:cell division protein FtsZ [Hwanghaeella grinnelliae]RVU34621.1 cell division protein FtsZ [Hwanghaeella grinnelliae]
MTIKFTPPGPDPEMKPRIVVVGVGGAGGNAVNNMIASNLEGVEFVVANTDAQALTQSSAERCIQLGSGITKGLGAGAQPEVGRAAAEEAMPELMEHLAGANMLFITAGMGGGTGTGAAPVIAEAAREKGMLTVGVITKPFHFEGRHRMKLAEQGIEELQGLVDTLIIIPNQNLFRVANEKTTFADAFKLADDVLYSGVRGVTDLMVMPGLINLDFADIRTVMSEMGKAMMGTGEAEGEDRARAAAEAAISNPLLEDVTMKGALGVLINITGGPDMTLFEVDEAANRIREEVDENANIIFGSTFEEALEGKMRVSVVATGIEAEAQTQPRPASTRSISLTRPKRPAAAPSETEESGDTEAAAPAVTATVGEPAAETPATPIAAGFEVHTVNEEKPVENNNGQQENGESDALAASQPVEPSPAMTGAAETDGTVQRDQQEAVQEPHLFDELNQPTAEEQEAPEAPVARPAPEAAAPQPRRPDVTAPRDAFIPPPPITVKPAKDSQSDLGGDPFAEADLANGRSDAPKKRSNLFRRVTNVLGTKQDRSEEDAASVEQHPAARTGTGEPLRRTTAQTTQGAAPAQSSLDTQPSEERMEPASPADSELLEIPAFLRRQAN